MTYPSPHPMWALGTGCDPSYHCDGVPGRAVSSKTGFPGQVLSPPSAPALCTCPPHLSPAPGPPTCPTGLLDTAWVPRVMKAVTGVDRTWGHGAGKGPCRGAVVRGGLEAADGRAYGG